MHQHNKIIIDINNNAMIDEEYNSGKGHKQVVLSDDNAGGFILENTSGCSNLSDKYLFDKITKDVFLQMEESGQLKKLSAFKNIDSVDYDDSPITIPPEPEFKSQRIDIYFSKYTDHLLLKYYNKLIGFYEGYELYARIKAMYQIELYDYDELSVAEIEERIYNLHMEMYDGKIVNMTDEELKNVLEACADTYSEIYLPSLSTIDDFSDVCECCHDSFDSCTC